MEFSRQEYWTELPFPSSGDHSHPGMEPRSPALPADSFYLSHQIEELYIAQQERRKTAQEMRLAISQGRRSWGLGSHFIFVCLSKSSNLIMWCGNFQLLITFGSLKWLIEIWIPFSFVNFRAVVVQFSLKKVKGTSKISHNGHRYYTLSLIGSIHLVRNVPEEESWF